MALNFVPKEELEKLSLNRFKEKPTNFIVFSNSPVQQERKQKRFSFVVFAIGFSLFVFLVAFQFWANAVENPQMLSSKPYFHILVAIPFSFEISLATVGLLLFIRFLLVNYESNKTINSEIKDRIQELDDSTILLYTPKDSPNSKLEEHNFSNRE